MNKLAIYNNKILNKYRLIKTKNELSAPLLVSSNNSYLESLDNDKTLYIGQETNCWVNYYKQNFDYSDLDYRYKDFLDNNTNNELFWKFIRSVIDNDKVQNIVWTNTLIAGKRYGKGTPEYNKELIDISTKYLIFLYKYFKPKYTIIVNGPNNPYYNITKNFLNYIDSNIKEWPTIRKPLIIDNNKNILWTYHPNYLNRSNNLNNVQEDIKKLIKLK